MAERWRDPTAVGAVYADPSAPISTAPVVASEPDPVYRDDALFAAAGAHWRAVAVPVPPAPVLTRDDDPVTARSQASVAPEVRPGSAGSGPSPWSGAAGPAYRTREGTRGGARSTYTAPVPVRGGRRPAPARPPGSVTMSPSTWLPAPAGPVPTTPWRQQPAPPTWLPTSGSTPPTSGRRGPGPVTYRATGRGARRARTDRRSGGKGWIPGVAVLAIVVLANVLPHLGRVVHHDAPAGVDQAVNSYYRNVESGDLQAAGRLVCETSRLTWTSGQSASDSDTRRGIQSHSITSTHSDGSDNYTVRVTLTLAGVGTQRATLKVLKDSSTDWRVCGGTNP